MQTAIPKVKIEPMFTLMAKTPLVNIIKATAIQEVLLHSAQLLQQLLPE